MWVQRSCSLQLVEEVNNRLSQADLSVAEIACLEEHTKSKEDHLVNGDMRTGQPRMRSATLLIVMTKRASTYRIYPETLANCTGWRTPAAAIER